MAVFERVDLAIGPPGFFIRGLGQLPVVATERHSEVITDFQANAARLRKSQMMRVGWRAARGILRWSGQTLAEKAGVGIQTIKRMEAVDGVPPGRAATVSDVQRALEAAGIEFINENGGGPGVRLRERQRQKKPK